MSKLFMYLYMSFGEWLRRRLIESRLTNAELARQVGVSATYIGNLVRDYSPNTKTGKGRPSEELVTRIANALSVPVDDARLAAGYAPFSPPPEKPRTVAELLDAIESLGVDQIMFPGGVESLRDMDEDDLADILDSVRAVIEVELQRKHRRRRKENNS